MSEHDKDDRDDRGWGTDAFGTALSAAYGFAEQNASNGIDRAFAKAGGVGTSILGTVMDYLDSDDLGRAIAGFTGGAGGAAFGAMVAPASGPAAILSPIVFSEAGKVVAQKMTEWAPTPHHDGIGGYRHPSDAKRSEDKHKDDTWGGDDSTTPAPNPLPTPFFGENGGFENPTPNPPSTPPPSTPPFSENGGEPQPQPPPPPNQEMQ